MKKIALSFLLSLIAMTIFNELCGDPSLTDVDLVLRSPSLKYFFGTDSLGRDLFWRVFSGAKISLGICGLASVLSTAFGFILGGALALFPPKVNSSLTRVFEVVMAVPYVVFVSTTALVIQIFAPVGSYLNILISLTISATIPSARFIRNLIQKEKTKIYVESAQLLGCSKWIILKRHISPNVKSAILVYWGLQLPQSILSEGVLSFLGLGVRTPQISWGQLLADGWKSLAIHPHLLVGPSLIFILTIFSINLLLDSYRIEKRFHFQLRNQQ